jgi:hypothetical protein
MTACNVGSRRHPRPRGERLESLGGRDGPRLAPSRAVPAAATRVAVRPGSSLSRRRSRGDGAPDGTRPRAPLDERLASPRGIWREWCASRMLKKGLESRFWDTCPNLEGTGHW